MNEITNSELEFIGQQHKSYSGTKNDLSNIAVGLARTNRTKVFQSG